MRLLSLALCGFTVAAATVAGVTCPAAEEDEKVPRVCVNRREINAISALDDRHAFVKASAGRFYLFTLDKTCYDFKHARQIAISDATSSRVCGDGSTLLSFAFPGVGTTRCRIDRLDTVKDRSAALELIAERTPPQ